MINRRRTHLVIPLLALSVILALAPAILRAGESGRHDRNSAGKLRNYTTLDKHQRHAGRGDPASGSARATTCSVSMAVTTPTTTTAGTCPTKITVTSPRSTIMPSQAELSRVPREHWRSYPSGWEVTASSQGERSGGAVGTLQVSFGSAPHWVSISGTRVEEMPQAERPDYDMFRIDGSYYAYDNDRWYMSREDHGDFTAIDHDAVPSGSSRVPREHWHTYPSGWAVGNSDPQTQGSVDMSMSMEVSFGTKPHWTGIHGTHVKEIRQGSARTTTCSTTEATTTSTTTTAGTRHANRAVASPMSRIIPFQVSCPKSRAITGATIRRDGRINMAVRVPTTTASNTRDRCDDGRHHPPGRYTALACEAGVALRRPLFGVLTGRLMMPDEEGRMGWMRRRAAPSVGVVVARGRAL